MRPARHPCCEQVRSVSSHGRGAFAYARVGRFGDHPLGADESEVEGLFDGFDDLDDDEDFDEKDLEQLEMLDMYRSNLLDDSDDGGDG